MILKDWEAFSLAIIELGEKKLFSRESAGLVNFYHGNQLVENLII